MLPKSLPHQKKRKNYPLPVKMQAQVIVFWDSEIQTEALALTCGRTDFLPPAGSHLWCGMQLHWCLLVAAMWVVG
jgi:hypothetical protein